MAAGPPERLAGEGAALRRLRPSDVAPYAGAFAEDAGLGPLLGFESDPDETSVRRRVARSARQVDAWMGFELVIADPATDAFLGVVVMHSLEPQHRRGEVGFWLLPGARRAGLGRSAVRQLVDWGFETLDLLRIELTTTPDNAAALALAEGVGFAREGVMRLRNVERGRRVDVVMLSLLREQWPA